MIYQVPQEYYFRLHHIRPRFKGEIENVLIYVATEIAKVGTKPRSDFNEAVNRAIKNFPGNAIAMDKTINNWRTEISALFGFITTSSDSDTLSPGRRAIELANNQDLVASFKTFLYFFQYPGGHLKPHEILEEIKHGIKFKPAYYILKLLTFAQKLEKERVGINKAELTHCIFNDLRVTRDDEALKNVWMRIKTNRTNEVGYEQQGDVVRYAGDILDYMVIANLLEAHDGFYYLNSLEKDAIPKFLNGSTWFDGYDKFYNQESTSLEYIRNQNELWFNYVNKKLPEDFFATDILTFISKDTEDYNTRKKELLATANLAEVDKGKVKFTTKQIGDDGESLVHGHECMRMKVGGREDLVHLIKFIPTHLAVGYDIHSREFDETSRFIEVKTTISSKALDFTRFHLTTNEWMVAESLGERYFVYRLLLNKDSKKLYLLKNPVRQYKDDKLQMTPRDGADITFNPDLCGQYTPLLEWED